MIINEDFMSRVGIVGTGIALPKKVLTNQDLEKMVETNDEWIITRTGIRERRILSPDEKMSDLVVQAARTACARSRIDPAELDFIICSTLHPDRVSPAQAYEVSRDLRATRAFAFDLNAACTGLIYGLAAAESFLKTRPIKAGLVAAGEQVSTMVDYTDRNTCVLFGDAAAAVVVSNQNPEHLLIATELGNSADRSEEVVIGGFRDLKNGHPTDYYFRQNGKSVFKFAVGVIRDLYDRLPRLAGLRPEDINYIIPHQANSRIIEAVAKDLNGTQTEILSNIEKYGNTSSASIGLALDEFSSRFHKGDTILLIGFGGGLSWGAALLEW